ncbi:hypothetical protein CVT24_010276 [Panaeolus cyanescens]|uniref:Apple domain-containing protein n=1 Tax=Panaeolus cyanescens TaxID=181874 RepID=A0A409W905_9AGAR|nr:hypothetical protein CVT24_010276 [Panaeolus cyanescens]
MSISRVIGVLQLFILVSLARASHSGTTPTPTLKSHFYHGPWAEEGTMFSKSNNYGAPIPPWAHGAIPGWSHCPESSDSCRPDVPCLQYGASLCNILSYFPDTLHCPHPASYARHVYKRHGNKHSRRQHRVAKRTEPSQVPNPKPYELTFSNFTGAVQADDYMTFGLVDTVEACLAMCDNVQGCHFANTYHDVNGKDGSPLLTCSLFQNCHDVSFATNFGGQTQPDGSLNHIEESYGWCKST